MQEYDIRDIALAPSGHEKIEWVRNNMPLLRGLEDEFKETRPLEGVKISLSVHLEAKTAYLCKVLTIGGAQMYVTGSNVLSTQDDVAAALVDDGQNTMNTYTGRFHRSLTSLSTTAATSWVCFILHILSLPKMYGEAVKRRRQGSYALRPWSAKVF